MFSILLLSFLGACAVPNQLTQLQAPDSVIKTDPNDTNNRRFNNLYPGEKDYPLTCRGECYPPSPVVSCEAPAENCQFIGEQKGLSIDAGFSITWLGHASFYIQGPEGSTVLIDPVSGQFDWPVNWAFYLSAGYNRGEPDWLEENKIKSVDAVAYSHIHYDHFNKDDIAKIGTEPEYLLPLGFAEHFPQRGYKLTEMAWFSTQKVNQLDMHFVPAHHFSSRIWVPFLYDDSDTTLWGGWVLEHDGKRLFYAGDTGYSKHFKDIQQKYGNMDVCLIPIASYFHEEHGQWYRYVHTTPEDALTAAQELNCKVMIPWGYGNASWKMGDHSSHSPLLRLLHMHDEMNSQIPLHILNEGESVEF
ncbi:MBL fold metallo-hydrolase [Aliiglaciecola sp. M165]|nr:MBL fold metallo-hydrolase [Aliiglaciecola sp. M165]